MDILGVTDSLFERVELQSVWDLLFDEHQVAWECVASKEECALALSKCFADQPTPQHLKKYLPDASAFGELQRRFTGIDWDDVPDVLASGLKILIERVDETMSHHSGPSSERPTSK